jgi:hypothetical protein
VRSYDQSYEHPSSAKRASPCRPLPSPTTSATKRPAPSKVALPPPLRTNVIGSVSSPPRARGVQRRNNPARAIASTKHGGRRRVCSISSATARICGANPLAASMDDDETVLSMPSGRKPDLDAPLSNAERQARCATRRGKRLAWLNRIGLWIAAAAHNARTMPRPNCSHYRPPMPPGSKRCRTRCAATAEALQAIVDLDLETLAAIELPRGYGRD